MASFGMYKPKSSVSFALRAIAEPARSKQNDKSHPVSQLSTFTPRLRHTRRIKSSSHSPHSSRRSIDRSIDAHEESESEKNARPDPLSDQIRTRPLIDPSSRSPTPPLLSTRRRIVTRIVHHSHIIRNKKNTRLTSNPHSNLNQIKITNPINRSVSKRRPHLHTLHPRTPSIHSTRHHRTFPRRPIHAPSSPPRTPSPPPRRPPRAPSSSILFVLEASCVEGRGVAIGSVPFGLRHDGDPIDRS